MVLPVNKDTIYTGSNTSRYQRIWKLQHRLTKYCDFSELVDLPCWWSCIGKGLRAAWNAGLFMYKSVQEEKSPSYGRSLHLLRCEDSSTATIKTQSHSPKINFAPNRPLGRFGLVVAMSALDWLTLWLCPLPMQLFCVRGLVGTIEITKIEIRTF